MKHIITIITLLTSAIFASAQDSWKISLNKKTVLISSESNEKLNTKKIKSSEWNKNGFLEINFKEADTGFWKRTFQFEDEIGNQLLTKESIIQVKIPLSALRKLFNGKKELKIYMVASPINPEIAVRMQRVHLCTLKLP
jgi:hypothetical protein